MNGWDCTHGISDALRPAKLINATHVPCLPGKFPFLCPLNVYSDQERVISSTSSEQSWYFCTNYEPCIDSQVDDGTKCSKRAAPQDHTLHAGTHEAA